MTAADREELPGEFEGDCSITRIGEINPGTGSQRVPVRVPRVRSVAGGEIPLRSYEELSPDGAVNELLLRRVLGSPELSREAIRASRGRCSSVQASAAKLRLGATWWRSSWTGKCLPMVVALGITITGDKRFLGFVETSTENEQVLTQMERGLDILKACW